MGSPVSEDVSVFIMDGVRDHAVIGLLTRSFFVLSVRVIASDRGWIDSSSDILRNYKPLWQ